MELYKRYVDVVVKQTKNGNIVPLYVCWDNGMSYQIDKVLSKERRASQVGGCGVDKEEIFSWKRIAGLLKVCIHNVVSYVNFLYPFGKELEK